MNFTPLKFKLYSLISNKPLWRGIVLIAFNLLYEEYLILPTLLQTHKNKVLKGRKIC